MSLVDFRFIWASWVERLRVDDTSLSAFQLIDVAAVLAAQGSIHCKRSLPVLAWATRLVPESSASLEITKEISRICVVLTQHGAGGHTTPCYDYLIGRSLLLPNRQNAWKIWGRFCSAKYVVIGGLFTLELQELASLGTYHQYVY